MVEGSAFDPSRVTGLNAHRENAMRYVELNPVCTGLAMLPLARGRPAKRANQPDETGLWQELVLGLKSDAGKNASVSQ